MHVDFLFQYQIIVKHFEDILEVIKFNSCNNKQHIWLKCGVEVLYSGIVVMIKLMCAQAVTTTSQLSPGQQWL